MKKAIEAGTKIERIVLVGYNSDMARAFERALLTV
jgi:hypothetical protein